ncbi:MAG: haloacid dehalogenase-like hydrolase [Candidatus Obscuribacterales bacterium]|nr:haloacid dehalogenase-like hydrolase [Candidatus Obscuribacterales bacterium]
MKNIAVIFDFDDTLMPDSTTELIKAHGIDPDEFWGKTVRDLLLSGYEPALAYLNRLLENVGKDRPLGEMSNAKLREFGLSLGKNFYPGVSGLFKELREIAGGVSADINLEFYVVSGGLQDLIEEMPLLKKNFTAVYGCQFGECPKSGLIKQIKKCVTFTEKTRYLFEINKGISPRHVEENKYAVNKDVPLQKRRVPFKNMIYVGDGLTDIPCFSLVKRMGGMAFGVFNPGEERSAKRALLEFLNTDRVISMHAPRYRKTDELGALLRAAVSTVAQRAHLDSSQAETDD